MSSISHESMREYLSKSISSINANKINGMLAEIDLRNRLSSMGFSNRISLGGWIFRSTGEGMFGHFASVVFPKIIQPDNNYTTSNLSEDPPSGLHTICATMHQIGVHSFFCSPIITEINNSESIKWFSKQLGVPENTDWFSLENSVPNHIPRTRRYNFLRYHTNSEMIPNDSLAAEFTKEHLRISLQTSYLGEISDIDGIIWGNQYTYPIEIKEKTVAKDRNVGHYFGIDVGPFVKLAYYAAKRGNLHSLFFVREINNTTDRELVNWWFIPFDRLAQFASWVTVGGGQNMQGGGSTVIKIPKNEFSELTEGNLRNL